MSGGWYWARATMRRNLRGAALLVLLMAVGAGATMALAAGARRTESSYRRLLAASNEWDAFTALEDQDGLRRLVEDSPLVAESLVAGIVHLHPVGMRCSSAAADFYPMLLPADDGDPYRMSRPRVLAGRLPRPGVADEVALPERVAARFGLGVGDELRLFLYDDVECGDAASSARQPVAARLRVVGLVRHSYELGLGEDDHAIIMLPFAFRAAHPDVPEDPFAVVRLKSGPAGLAGFDAAARRAGADGADPSPGAGGPVQPALGTAATGLWVTAGVVALGTLVALVIFLLRQAGALGRELRVLAALGVPRRGAAAGAAVPAAVAVVLGVAGSVAVAVGASPGLPIGLGRRADPDPGVHADWAVLAAGALAALGVGLVLAGLTAWRAVRAAGEPDLGARRRRPSRLMNGLSRSGAPSWATIGTGYALGAGRGGKGPAGALAGTVMGVAGVVAVTLFGLSLDRTVTDPGRYGWGQWNAVVSPDPGHPTPASTRLEALTLADPAVEAVSLVLLGVELALDGEPVRGLVAWPRRERAGPTVVSGRLPDGHDEIALGSETARRLGKRVGDRVDAGGGEQHTGATSPLEVVGITAFPEVENGVTLRNGFVLSNDGWAGLGEEFCVGTSGVDLEDATVQNIHDAWNDCFFSGDAPVAVAVALADGADPDGFAARMASQGAFVNRSQPGGEILRLDEVKAVPRILAVLLGLLAALGVSHTLWVTLRWRRRDLATLRALGFTRIQVRRVLHTQAVALTTAGVAGGVVGGVIAGRLAWEAAAETIGVPTDLHLRLLPLLAVAVAAVAGARLLAVLPGRVAGRATPAFGFREET